MTFFNTMMMPTLFYVSELTQKYDVNIFHIILSISLILNTILIAKNQILRNDLNTVKNVKNGDHDYNVYGSFIKEYLFLDVMHTLKGLVTIDEIYSFMNNNITSLKKAEKFLKEFKNKYKYN